MSKIKHQSACLMSAPSMETATKVGVVAQHRVHAVLKFSVDTSVRPDCAIPNKAIELGSAFQISPI